MTLEEWKNKNSVYKKYAHFDKRVMINDVWNYISNPKIVAKHGFYPFIHYTQVFKKIQKLVGAVSKEREICYSAVPCHAKCKKLTRKIQKSTLKKPFSR